MMDKLFQWLLAAVSVLAVLAIYGGVGYAVVADTPRQVVATKTPATAECDSARYWKHKHDSLLVVWTEARERFFLKNKKRITQKK